MIKKKKFFFQALISLLCGMLFCGCGKSEKKENALKEGFAMTILNTGKSDCILIEADGMVILNDTADEDDWNLIQRTLHKKNIHSIDYMILSHFDKDHIGSAAKVLEHYEVKCILMPDYEEKNSKEYDNLIKTISKYGVEAIHTDYFFEKDKLAVFVSAPKETSYKDENNYSMITSVTYGEHSYLLMGDALQKRLGEFFEDENIEVKQYDLVKLPHHGDYMKSLKKQFPVLKPLYGVITDDAKRDRVSDKLVNLLKDNDCIPMYTYEGTIFISSDGTSLQVEQR